MRSRTSSSRHRAGSCRQQRRHLNRAPQSVDSSTLFRRSQVDNQLLTTALPVVLAPRNLKRNEPTLKLRMQLNRAMPSVDYIQARPPQVRPNESRDEHYRDAALARRRRRWIWRRSRCSSISIFCGRCDEPWHPLPRRCHHWRPAMASPMIAGVQARARDGPTRPTQTAGYRRGAAWPMVAQGLDAATHHPQ